MWRTRWHLSDAVTYMELSRGTRLESNRKDPHAPLLALSKRSISANSRGRLNQSHLNWLIPLLGCQLLFRNPVDFITASYIARLSCLPSAIGIVNAILKMAVKTEMRALMVI